MSLEQRVKILETVTEPFCGVRELVLLLKWRTSNVISLLKKMQDEQLISMESVATPKKGRPKKHIKVTQLGIEFLDAYKKLIGKALKAKRQDLDHAAKDAYYAKRLEQKGHSTFQVFMELNSIASNIKNSAQTHQVTR